MENMEEISQIVANELGNKQHKRKGSWLHEVPPIFHKRRNKYGKGRGV